MTAIFQQAKQNTEVFRLLKAHIAMGLAVEDSEDETLNVEFQIAEIDDTFRQML